MKCAMVTLDVSQLSQTINVLYPQEVVGTNRGHRTPVLFQQILLDTSSIDDSDWFSAGMNELAAGSPSYGRAEEERKKGNHMFTADKKAEECAAAYIYPQRRPMISQELYLVCSRV